MVEGEKTELISDALVCRRRRLPRYGLLFDDTLIYEVVTLSALSSGFPDGG